MNIVETTNMENTVMNKPEQIKVIDYPFLITIGAIGVLISLACLIFSAGAGFLVMGFYMASFSLIISAFCIGKHLYSGVQTSPVTIDSFAASHTQNPHVMTSLNGEMIHCNLPYRVFLKDNLGRENSAPFDLMDVEQQKTVKMTLAALVIGAEETLVVPLISGEDEKKYTEVRLSRHADHKDCISWVFSGLVSEVPVEVDRCGDKEFSLDQLGGFLDSSDCGLVALSEEGQIIYANEILLHWLTGQSAQDLQLPLPLANFCSVAASQLNGQLNGQIHVQTLSGEDVLLEFLPIETMLGDNKKQGPAHVDFTDRTAAVYQVFFCQSEPIGKDAGAENINIDKFFRESPIGIAIITEQGDVLEKNSVFREYIQELDIKNTRSLKYMIDPEEYTEFYDNIKTTLSTGRASSFADIGFRGKGEKHCQVYITSLNKFDDHDKVAILYLIDTTEQKNLELQFAQSQKMQAVGQLAGGVAHDFNNLLTAIIGFSDLLLVRHGPGDQSFSDIIQVKQNANRAANLVRQLLAFSRQQTLRPKVLIITDVLAELANLLRRLIGDNIELDMTHGRKLGHVKVDQGQMEQVIINLCVNARDAMDDQGKMSIRTRNISLKESIKLNKRYQVMPPNEYVLLEVEDTGCGIAKEHMGKIFEPFFSTKEVGKGTGLGLSTVYGIVKQTGGFVFPNSEVNKGTTFSIYLPVHKDVQKTETEAEIEEIITEKVTVDLTGKGTILLVEDEDAVRMFASRALKNKGYNVYEANSGEAALKLFETIEDELDLLISDVVMPIMDGPTLVRKIRKTNSRLKVIFISGYAEDAFEKTPGEDDFHFLPKPFSLKQLAEQVKEVLDGG